MFFFPLFDNNPTMRRPFISWLILIACISVFMWQQSLSSRMEQIAVLQYGFIPANAFGIAMLPDGFSVLPGWATAFSSMFLHGGWMHIGGNMLYLWIFGDNVEDSMGRVKFILFYALCGVAAALAQGLIDPSSKIPMIGASGGIAGILGAYLVLHPKAAIRTIVIIFVFIRFINMPAWVVLGVWIGLQFVAVPNALSEDGGGVAYLAHIGGFAAGMILIPFFKRRDVALFGRNDEVTPRWQPTPMSFSTVKAEARQRYARTGNRRQGSVPSFSRNDRPKGPWDK